MARETIAGLRREIDDLRADRNHLREQLADAKVQIQIMQTEVDKAKRDSHEAQLLESDYQECIGILRKLGVEIVGSDGFLYKPRTSGLILQYIFKKFGASLDLPADQS